MHNTSERMESKTIPKTALLPWSFPKWPQVMRDYGLALLLVVLGAAIRWTLTLVVGPGLPTYTTFYVVVMFVALIAGVGPGLLATLATMVVVDLWILPPYWHFGYEDSADAIGQIIFLGMGVFMSVVAGLYRRTRGHLEELVATRTAALSQANEQLQREMANRRQLEADRAQLAAIVEFSDDAIISKDLNGIIRTWNAGAERLLGYRAEEMIGQPITRLLPPERSGEEAAILERLHRGEYVEHFETVRIAKDGRRVDVSASISPLRSADGRMIGASKILRDITASKRAEQALRESHDRLKRVVDVETVGVMFWDLSTGRMTDANDAFLRIMGYSRREVEARELTWQKLTPPEYLEVSRAEIEKFTATGRVGPYEKEYFRKDGTRQWFVFAGSSLGGNACVEFCVDISDRKKAEAALRGSEERLRAQAAELVAINKDLEQFAYVASHDLQEPLRAVGGFLTLLQQRYRGQLDAKADEYIGAAVEGATRMQTLINGLLEYSRVGTRGNVPAPAPADAALQEALENLQTLVQESGATVTADPLPVVRADAAQLTHVFQNLVANALKFRSERAPEIHVGARRQDDAWLFWVRDNGIGIEPQYGDRIFVIFQRLHTRSKYPGTGLGLAICKRIVERHGGRIWVESQPGQGATFYFTLPDKGESHESST